MNKQILIWMNTLFTLFVYKLGSKDTEDDKHATILQSKKHAPSEHAIMRKKDRSSNQKKRVNVSHKSADKMKKLFYEYLALN